MKNLSLLVSLVIVAMIAIVSCEHEPFPAPPPGTNPVDTTTNPNDTTQNPNDTTQNPNDTTKPGKPCDPDTIYFERDILPILSSNCAYSGCHDANTASDDVILDSYINVMTSKADVRPGDPDGSDLYEVITETDPGKRMPPPPNSPLTNAQIQKIRKWILQGAQDLSCDECDTSSVSFQNDIFPIFETSCQNCHGGSTPSANRSMENYSEIRDAVENSEVLPRINHVSGYPPMPPSGIKLDECKINKIEAWAMAGYPNN